MKVFLDTNILIDFLAYRPPFTDEALKIFELAESSHISLFTSSHAIVTTHYLLKKYTKEDELRQTLIRLCELITILDVTQGIIKSALKSAHKDFEDAVQMLTSESSQSINFIITRNLKDFKESAIPAISAQELLAKF